MDQQIRSLRHLSAPHPAARHPAIRLRATRLRQESVMTAALHLGFDNTYATELEGLYVPFTPPGFPAPQLVQLNRALLGELVVDADLVERHAAALLSGSLIPDDATPLAQAYAGHQFGGFSPQLGDGRAVLLGELYDHQGHLRDLQLKGSGRTPFSRGGDGKATLGPILREYLLGEAMHHLGVPTTRVLAAMTTGEPVWRSERLPGAVLARVAASHLRVGTLQFFAARRDTASLIRLVDYSLARHYPHLLAPDANDVNDTSGAGGPGGDDDGETVAAQQARRALALLRAVAVAQAELIADWMRVGFIHGVMNTDNVTLSGETIDYGPCAFLEAYDPATVYSSIDHAGRYAYGRQPTMGQWNLARMGEALLPLLAPDEAAAINHVEGALRLFVETYDAATLSAMRQKLGLTASDDDDTHARVDGQLIADLLSWMHTTAQDYTLTFRRLADGLVTGTFPFGDTAFSTWRRRWQARLGDEAADAVAARMNAYNPLYIPRNHLVEAALDAAIGGDLTLFETLLAVLASPFAPQPGRASYAEAAPSDFGPYHTFCGT